VTKPARKRHGVSSRRSKPSSFKRLSLSHVTKTHQSLSETPLDRF